MLFRSSLKILAIFMSILHMVLQSQVLWLLPVLFLLPTVAAMPNAEKNSFPDLTFKVFSDFIFSLFSSQVTLATVLGQL